MVKSPDVIERMRVACRIARDVLVETGAAVAPGVTTDELDRVAHEAHIARGVYPSPLGYHGLPEVGVHVGQRGDLPRHPRRPPARRRRHRQRRRHRLRRRRARRHQRDVLRRPRRPALASASCASPRSASTSRSRRCARARRVSDIGRAIETARARATGFFVVRTFVGHGIGEVFHGPPQVPHYYEPSARTILEPGMVVHHRADDHHGQHRRR